MNMAAPVSAGTAPTTRLVFSKPLLAGVDELDEPHAAASINGNTPKTAVATSCLTLFFLMTLLSGVKNSGMARKVIEGHRGAASHGQAAASGVSDPLIYVAV
jgi:hypothetical protein